jgi:hypothetical protein
MTMTIPHVLSIHSAWCRTGKGILRKNAHRKIPAFFKAFDRPELNALPVQRNDDIKGNFRGATKPWNALTRVKKAHSMAINPFLQRVYSY